MRKQTRVTVHNSLAYVISYVPPGGNYTLHGRFSAKDVEEGRRSGYLAEGMRFTHRGIEYEVVGPECGRQQLVRVE